MKTSKYRSPEVTIERFGEWLALVPFALPLLYLSPISNVFQTELYRAALIVLCGSLALALLVQRRKKWSFRLAGWQYVVAAYMLLATVSTLLSKQPEIGIFGMQADYQGLATLLGSIVLAYWTSRYSKELMFWRKAGSIMGVVCILSCVVSGDYVLHGYRLAGLLVHATGVSFYAVMALDIALITKFALPHKQRRDVLLQYAYILAAVLVIGFSGSRIGAFSFILTMMIIGFYFPALRKLIATSVLGLVIIAGLSYSITSPVQRLTDPRRVEVGMSYRFDLYKWSIRQADVSMLGVGTAQVSRVLNDHPKVTPPASIQETFKTGFPLWYTHSQLIDTYVEYGLLGLGLVLYMFAKTYSSVLHVVKTNAKRLTPQSVIIITLLIGMTLNFLINTPSIELTPILFISIFCALQLSLVATKKSTR